jgi:hypothetical protein
MKVCLWIVLIFMLPVSSFAGDDSSGVISARFDDKNDSMVGAKEGEIDGERFHITISQRDGWSMLAVFRRDAGRYVSVGKMKLPPSPPSLVTVTISKNSIFVEASFCHHGCTDTRYQFKKVESLFRLIGIESQNETWCSYYDTNAPSDCNYSVRSGDSFNLLSSTAVCWAEDVAEGRGPEKTQKQYQPRGVQHRMTFSRVDPPLLDGFSPDDLILPKSCYFDSNGRYHVYDPRP